MEIEKVHYEASIKIGEHRAKVLEELVELHLQPKQRWMPNFIWHWLIKKMLIWRIHDGSTDTTSD